ncbi:ead/Ea22-like family protein [Enterobacter roggenkampii]|uniref:ead/Ea22-like family protein n=1 Tax=Enterobacter roggenkampii TaxID=1812935 RepID=UPI003D6EF71A
MSNIDKQALREAAEKANPEQYGYYLVDAFAELVTPATVLALLDDLEAAQTVSAARLVAIDTTHKMFQRERDRAEKAEKRIAELSQKADIYDMLRQDYGLQGSLVEFVDWQAKRIAELERKEQHSERQSVIDALAGSGEAWSDIEEYMQEWDAARAAMLQGVDSNSPVIPDGWVAVPVEPTEHMIVEGFESEPDEFFSDSEVWEEYDAMSGCQQAAHRAKLCWAAMIAAAPKPEVK